MGTKRLLTLALLIFATTVGCSSQQHYTVLSNRLVRTSDFNLDDSAKSTPVSVEASTTIFIIFPIGRSLPLEHLLEEALDLAEGDVVTNVTVTEWGWYIPLIYGSVGLRIEGDVVRTRHADE